MLTVSPLCSTAVTFFGDASSDDRRLQLVVVRIVLQGLGDARVELLRVGGQIDVVFRAAVDLPLLEVHDAPAQGVIGQRLVGRIERQVDVQAARVGIGAELVEDDLPRRLGDVLGVHGDLGRRAVLQHLLQRRVALLGRDEAVLVASGR